MNGLEAGRGVFGLTQLIQPRPIYRVVTGATAPSGAVIVMRVLGARHLLQAVVLMRANRSHHRLGAVVDLSHAATMIALAVVDRRWRRAAGADAVFATTLAALEFR